MRRTLLALLCVSVVWTQDVQDSSKGTQDVSPRKEDGLEANPWSPFFPDEAYLLDELETMIPDSLRDNVMSHPDDAARFLLPPDMEAYHQEKEGTRQTPQQPEEYLTAPKLESGQDPTEVASNPGQPRRKRSLCLKCMMKKHGLGGGGGYGGGQQQEQQQQQQQHVYIVQQPQQPQYQPQPQPQYHPQPQPQYRPQPQPQYHPQPQPQYHPQPQQQPQQCSSCGHPPNGGGGGGGYSQSSSNSQSSSGGYGGGWGKK